MLTAMFVMLPRAGVAADRIDEVLNMDISIKEAEEPKHVEKTAGVLKFSHVDFTYPGSKEAAITDIDFTANPGQTTAIIGSTGCGKSTIVNLIPRLYDVTEGSITLDGTDIPAFHERSASADWLCTAERCAVLRNALKLNLRFWVIRTPVMQMCVRRLRSPRRKILLKKNLKNTMHRSLKAEPACFRRTETASCHCPCHCKTSEDFCV